MTNEEFVRQAYAIAEVKDLAAWIACFNPDGVFGKDSEVGTVAIPGRPEWIGTPGPNGYRHSAGALIILFLNEE